MKQDNTHPTQEEIIEWNRAQNSKADAMQARHERRADLQGRTLAQYEATSRTMGWAWMAAIVMIIILMVTCQTAPAQTMYEVEYASQADLLLYEVKYPAQADIRYYPVQWRSQANERRNHWYWTDYPAQAKYRVYWVRYRSQADRTVYEVQYPTQTR